MKTKKVLKVVLVILFIILISLISFGGIFVQNTKFVENIVPDYQWGMDLTGSRVIGLAISEATNTVIYDEEGNVVSEEGENTTTVEEPVNPEESLTQENFQKAKELFEKRLKEMNVASYTIRFDNTTGKAIIQLPENSNTDIIAQYTAIKGVFTVEDEEGNVLLDNSHLEKAQVGYGSTTSGTTIYLTIQFNKEGTQILKDITNTYVKTTDEDGNETTKTISLKVDDTTLLNTYFESEISNGMLQLSMGQASTSTDDLNSYLQEASNLAVLLNTGANPLTYTIEENRYVLSDITPDMFFIPAIVVLALIGIGMIFFIIRYRKNGLLTAISFIGFIAVLLLVLRLANVMITLEGIIGILIGIVLNYIFCFYLLHLLKHNPKTIQDASNNFKEALLKTLFILVPVSITCIVLCFSGWLPIYSFGMVMFWSILISVLYNLIITRTLIVSCIKSK